MKVAVVGATGMVGQVMLGILEQRRFPVTELIPVASERSLGKKVTFKGAAYPCVLPQTAIDRAPQLALFSAGGSTSLEWAPRFAAAGATVIDNSSAWRMEPDIPLVIPEINAGVLRMADKIIANPNCSTMQMLIALAPLHKVYAINRIIVSTYQSVSGTGVAAVQQLENEEKNTPGEMVYPYPIHRNCLPHCDVFLDNGYTREEMKLANETRKILDPAIRVTATAVRVPVVGGHSEAVNVEFNNPYELSDVRRLLSESDAIKVVDNTDVNQYPMPVYAAGKDEVFVGRIRRDETRANALNLWVVSDNLRKGAATNAVQIAEYLIKENFLKGTIPA